MSNGREVVVQNEMSVYNLNDILSPHLAMNDISNAVALRADVHKTFDDKKVVFVPKSGRWVTHFLKQTHNMGGQYHNVQGRRTSMRISHYFSVDSKSFGSHRK